jgi:serine O-acetyltransferase
VEGAIIKDMPPNSTVLGIPGRAVKRNGMAVKFDLRHGQLPDPMLDSLMDIKRHITELEDRMAELEDQIERQK